MKRELVYIDIYETEGNGNEIWFLGHYFSSPLRRNLSNPAEVCNSTGLFIEEDELNEFLEENKEGIEIVEDYRKL